MAGKSLTKEFHRLMRRIGRLTDDQASIDDVDWDEGGLSSFRVTIRPNASYYKGGRFKFTVRIPHDCKDGRPPNVWCDTDIYHPNIDRHTSLEEEFTNVCLSMFDDRTCHGLEGVIIGILFLMHHPNLNDPLSPEFDSSCISDEEFRKNVVDYMAGKTVDGEYEFSIDFRVIDGEFKDLTLTENSIGGSTNEDGIAGASCDTNDRGNGNDVVEAIEGPIVDTERDVENEKISAQDFHRLARRIGRITDGQAFIDGGEWEEGGLSSFKVTIRPNASYYKGGRFRFQVSLPIECKAGAPIECWCITEIYHPNIDTQCTGKVFTNVCFDSLDTTTESQCRSIEHMVLKLVFLMHHPNLNDPTSSEFESGSITEEEFRTNVLDYMAGEIARYTIDFCVIDGVFKDLTLIEDSEDEDEMAAANCDVNAVNSISINSDSNKNAVEIKADIVGKVLNDENVEGFDVHNLLNDASKTTSGDMPTFENITEFDHGNSKDQLDNYDEDDDAEVIPVKFVMEVDDCGSGYFLIDYTGHENQIQTDDTSNNNDISENNADSNIDCGRTIETVGDAPNTGGRERSKSISHMHETYRDPFLARSVSFRNERQAKAINMHKQPSITLVGTGLRGLLFFALDCVLSASKNML